ncbi:unnamed protein product [Blepharisma stoltei]|uniref:C2 domain-containing protein n=1 Tax=Blepharisma stoltei TaxID=1481888 RepID=A0AAU9J8X3_9CILI|nr:unnamed protein product [Blepharisma stoltei]
MGDCTSRVSKSELEQHMKDYNGKNDQSFLCIPYERTIDQTIAEDTNKRGLEEKLRLYQRKKLEFQAKLDSITAGSPQIPELNIEIQKGVSLYTEGLCFTKGQPYVTVQLEPKGPICETTASDTYKPYWYRLFELKQTLDNFSSLSFKVWSKENSSENHLFGGFQIKLNDLEDQRVKEGWYKLDVNDPSKEIHPSLRIRIQLIQDERALYSSLIQSCIEKSVLLTEALKSLENDEKGA